MAEISNNLIAGLLIVAILVSIVGLANTLTLAPVIRYTGVATGKANVSITSAVAIQLIRNESLFGSGFPNSAAGGILYIWSNNTAANWDGTAGTGSFNNGSQGNGTDYQTGTHVYPFVVRNTGNDPSTCVRICSSSLATAFIGGVAQTPEFKWSGMNNESTWSGTSVNPCAAGTLTTAWNEMTTSSATICNLLNHTDSNDELRIHFWLGIPEDAQGDKQAIVTVSGCNPCGSCGNC